MDPTIAPHAEGEAEWVASQRKWTCGWRRLVLVAIPLVYLTYVTDAVGQNSHGAGRFRRPGANRRRPDCSPAT